MKRLLTFGLLGLALAGLGYSVAFFAGTARCRGLQASAAPDLAWLKMEFHLGDAEFQQVNQLHNAYQPECQERCRKIDAKNAELRELLARSGQVTPAVEQALAEAAALRRECQTAMLKHFVEVSRAMPPEQGRRYLEWICARTLGPAHGSMTSDSPTAHAHDQPGH